MSSINKFYTKTKSNHFCIIAGCLTLSECLVLSYIISLESLIQSCILRKR